MNLKATRSYLFIVGLLLPLLVSCSRNTFKYSDRVLSEKMNSATLDHPGRINVNGKVYDGYNITIVGDSLEWYDEPEREGRRRTAYSGKVDAVMTKHPHDSWRYLFPIGGFVGGGAIGLEVAAMSAAVSQNGVEHLSIDWTTPIVSAVACGGLCYLGAILLDPGVQENMWIYKVVN